MVLQTIDYPLFMSQKSRKNFSTCTIEQTM